MNPVKAILLKSLSALLFAVMTALVRHLGAKYPVGQIVFFRSAFAILPVVLIYAFKGELAAALRTRRPLGHAGRGLLSIGGMFCNFSAFVRLPIVDATALSFTAPLMTVALSALILKERVRIYRWSAVSIGFLGILVMMAPQLGLSRQAATAVATIGFAFALTGALLNAANVIQTRRLTESETTSSIVFYFSLICALAGLATWPFGWGSPDATDFAALTLVGLCGGLAHIALTESYRFAPVSVVAPFDYTAMIWAFVLGYFFFHEIPSVAVFAGSAIVAAAGLFVLWRERQLGLERARTSAVEGPPVGR